MNDWLYKRLTVTGSPPYNNGKSRTNPDVEYSGVVPDGEYVMASYGNGGMTLEATDHYAKYVIGLSTFKALLEADPRYSNHPDSNHPCLRDLRCSDDPVQTTLPAWP